MKKPSNRFQTDAEYGEYLARMNGYADTSIKIQPLERRISRSENEPEADPYMRRMQSAFEIGSAFERQDETYISEVYDRLFYAALDNCSADIQKFWKLRTILIAAGGNSSEALSMLFSRLVYPRMETVFDRDGKIERSFAGRKTEYISINLSKVTSPDQFLRDLFVLTDYKRFILFFTEVEKVTDPEIQMMLIHMMKRDKYLIAGNDDSSAVDFGSMISILVNKTDGKEDPLPEFAKNRSLDIHIEQLPVPIQ